MRPPKRRSDKLLVRYALGSVLGIIFIIAGIHWHFSSNGIQATPEPEENGITVSGRCDLAGEPPTIPPEGEKYYIELNEATVQFGGNGLGRV